MPLSERDILIGKIVAPFGLRGEVKVAIHTDFPERMVAGRELTVIKPDGARFPSRIDKSTPNKGGLTIKFKGVETRNDSEELRGAEIVIDESELAELPEDNFYVFDLMGMKVITDDGREQGEVTEVLLGGANDVYVTSNGLCIPAIKDVVVKVDVASKVITIHPVPGLLAEDK